MAVIESGLGGGVMTTVDTKNKTLRITNRPIISNTLGSYQASLQSGVMAAGLAANAEVVQFRYTAGNLCLVEKVIFDGMGSIVAFAAGVAQFRLLVSRSYTASGSGGTAATLSGNNTKLRTDYPSTGVGDFRIASTAALVSPVGDVPDSQTVGAVLFGLPATAGAGVAEATLFDGYSIGHPIVLEQNEGLIMQATVPATGTWTFGFTIKWSEVTEAEWTI